MNLFMKTKISAWLEKCSEDPALLSLKSMVWKNEFEIARDFYSSDVCRESATSFLKNLQPVEVCNADKSEKLRSEGNKLFNKFETLPEAAVLYTRAIYKAPSNSRLLAEAHANRAAALYKLGEYEAAYEDCICALDSSHPKTRVIHLRLATIALKLCDSEKLEKCIERFEKERMNEESVFHQMQKLLAETTPKPLSANESPKPKGKKIKMLFSKERGRYLVADEDIEANEIVMQNAPAVVALNEQYRHRFLKTESNDLTFICDNCYEQDVVPFPCYQCRSVFYCSSKCLRDHTPIHQYECNKLKLDLGSEMDLIMRLLFAVFDRLLMKLQQANGSKVFDDAEHLWPVLLQAGEEDELMGLFMNFDHYQSMGRCFNSGLLATLCCYYLHQSDFFKTRRQTWFIFMRSEFEWQKVVAALLLRFHIQASFTTYELLRLVTKKPFAERSINANGLSKTLDGLEFGAVVCPRVALINHSCDSSCVPFVDKSTVTIISHRSICKGEELTVNYTFDITETRAQRKKYLWENFGFVCICPRCKSQLDLDYIQSNQVLCTCGNGLVLEYNFPNNQICPQCRRRLEVGVLVTKFLRTNLTSASVPEYCFLFDLYTRIKKFAPKTSTNIWIMLATQILTVYLQSENAEIHRDEKLLCKLTRIATDLLQVLEENKRIPVKIRAFSSMQLLDLIMIRKKNGFRKADLEYDLNKIKQTLWVFSGKERKWLEEYFDICEVIQSS